MRCMTDQEHQEAIKAAYRDGRRHACALLSLLVYDSDGEPLNTGSLLGICNDVEESIKPKG